MKTVYLFTALIFLNLTRGEATEAANQEQMQYAADTNANVLPDIPTPTDVPTRGTRFRGLVTTGTAAGLISGDMRLAAEGNGNFSAVLNLGGIDYRFTGKFLEDGSFTGTEDHGAIGVSLTYTGAAGITGTVSAGMQTLSYTAGPVSDTSAAGYWYRYIMSPGQVIGSGSAPEGTGYGDMYVRSNGEVSLVGRLPDGSAFSTATLITSGSFATIYRHMGAGVNSGVAGTLVFEDVPDVSDCSGTLYWAKPASARYPGGFEMATQFTASAYDKVIGGLDGATVSFSASGADLVTPLTTNITMRSDGNLDGGSADGVHLIIERSQNRFRGEFENPVTHELTEIRGVLLTKSRSGAGLFVSHGVSGTVTIQY